MTGDGTYVAVDGGNSKTHVVLGDGTGRVLAFARGPASSPHQIGVPGTVELLGTLIGDALDSAGLPRGTVVGRAEVYLAGADLPVEVDTLMKAVGEAGWAREHRVDNDLFALLRAGTPAPDAVAVVCGAGINCVARARDGRTARFPSLGSISGDWGGGQHLATLALWHAARGEDGRGPATALSAAVARYFDRDRVEDVSAGLHLGELDRGRVDGLSPLLFRVAGEGDEVARRIVAKQAREVVALVRVAAGRLGLLDRQISVVLGGGVLAARHPLLHEAVLAGIAEVAPHASVGLVADPPVTGAALLALDALRGGIGGTADIEAGVREAVRAAVR